MPGKKITDNQIRLYMKSRKEGKSQATAAAKAGFSERSARNVQNKNFQVSKENRTWKTKADPFEEIWQSELLPCLEENSKIQATTLLLIAQEAHPNKYPDNLLRTLQRRVKQWKAVSGPEKEVIFRQVNPPGWQGQSDFTDATKLKVTIRENHLDHILYHYRLSYSGWEYAQVVLGGESFSALTEGLQNALWECGGSPKTHRSDSLSAAYKNLSKDAQEDFTKGYDDFCSHYQMEATRNNKGVSHENGTIESSNRHLKAKIEQSLIIRGSRNFDSLESYKMFIHSVLKRHNQRVQERYLEELTCLQELPERRTNDFTEIRVKVTSQSTINVKSVIYSVPSRLVGESLKIHLYDDRLKCFVGGVYTITLERQRKGKTHKSQIDYRHLIEQLSKKPGAFANFIYKVHFFPTTTFQKTWDRLLEASNMRSASREYLAILKEAARGDKEEALVNNFLSEKLNGDHVVTAVEVQNLFLESVSEVIDHVEFTGDLESYDDLLGGQANDF